jgi:Zn-dependent metalloprotease
MNYHLIIILLLVANSFAMKDPQKVMKQSPQTALSKKAPAPLLDLRKSSASKKTDPILRYKKQANIPSLISIPFANPATASLSKKSLDPKEKAFRYLEQLTPYTQMNNPRKSFKLDTFKHHNTAEKSALLKQMHQNIPIEGLEIKVHFQNEDPTLLNGKYSNTIKLVNEEVFIDSLSALNIVINDLEIYDHYDDDFQINNNIGYRGPQVEQVWKASTANNNEYFLTWKIEILAHAGSRWVYYIKQNQGDVFQKTNLICNAAASGSGDDLNGVRRSFGVWQSGSKYYLIDAAQPMYSAAKSSLPRSGVGVIETLENGLFSSDYITSTSNSWSKDPSAVSAHYNAITTYNYFLDVHGRNSIDGAGGTISSFVHVTDWGMPMENAYWNGYGMYYGDGDEIFYPLAGGLDVGAHEMSHGIIQHTANLEYYGQSGALNESFADVFGAMVDRDDWLMGEDIIKARSYFPTGALRSLSDPHNGGSSLSDDSWQPKTMSEYVETSSDNGGVHINSGIPNYTFYLVAESIGKAKAEKIWYRALERYLTRSSDFEDFRIAVERATDDLYTSSELSQVRGAFNATGIGEDTGEIPALPGDTAITEDIPSHGGLASLVVLDPTLDYFDIREREFEESTVSVFDYAPLFTSAHPGFTPMSFTDNGLEGYYISADEGGKAIWVDFSTVPASHAAISPLTWDNIAVSKDGNRVALVSTEIDTLIWVYDYISSSWKTFKIYNPTFTDVVSGEALYADALEWDYTGEYLLFDSYNQISMSSYDDKGYWDVSLIKVWDASRETWGDGHISKILPAQPEGVSIGNATYSNNSSQLIAYDRYDANDGSYGVWVYNIETGAKGLIESNNDFGFPSFAKGDKSLVFQQVSDIFNLKYSIAESYLTPDRMSKLGDTYYIISDGRLPSWRLQGSRPLSGTEDQTPRLNNHKNSLLVKQLGNNYIIKIPESGGTLRLINTKGELMYQKNLSLGSQEYLLSTQEYVPGLYFININGRSAKITIHH